MDKIDKAILFELQRNGRLTNQELSERISMSPSPCLRRVRALEKSGIISGYCAIVDQEKYGCPINVFVSIKLDKPTERIMREFEARIEAIDDVMECYLMTGTHDYLLRVVCESLKSYEHLVRHTLTKLPNISSIESSFAFWTGQAQVCIAGHVAACRIACSQQLIKSG